MPLLHYGDRIRVETSLKLPPHNFRNPGAFDYEQYLVDHRANSRLGLGQVRKCRTTERLRRKPHSRVAQPASIEGWLPGSTASGPLADAALIDAMVIGEQAFIDRDSRADFQRSGTYHVLVVSGMNVSILAFVVFWALRRFRIADVPATLLTIAFCVAYAFTTEVGAPVWRATLLCAIYLATRLLYRDRAMVNALGAAALGLLIPSIPASFSPPAFR